MVSCHRLIHSAAWEANLSIILRRAIILPTDEKKKTMRERACSDNSFTIKTTQAFLRMGNKKFREQKTKLLNFNCIFAHKSVTRFLSTTIAQKQRSTHSRAVLDNSLMSVSPTPSQVSHHNQSLCRFP